VYENIDVDMDDNVDVKVDLDITWAIFGLA
jgi:hypothetical protein